MSDDPRCEYDRTIERAFRKSCAFDDSEIFSAEIDRRLSRTQMLRRSVIGVAGGAGGLLAVSQIVSSNLHGWLSQVARSTLNAEAAAAKAAKTLPQPDFTGQVLGDFFVNPLWFWAVCAGVVIAGLAAAYRFFDEA